MTKVTNAHSFHIPVMGIGFTIDTPIKVAHFGIDSVIPIGDHRLIESMREFHSGTNNIPFEGIDEKDKDARHNMIAAYLNLMKDLVDKNFENIKSLPFGEDNDLKKYFDMLPEDSALKLEYNKMMNTSGAEADSIAKNLKSNMECGAIDVNIMTKLDKVNYDRNKEALPNEYNDAHAALRGFAESNLDASIILSAGLNPRLYSYMSTFNDFLPDAEGKLKKRVILKVSDYRSAMIQGKFLAKKGLWVSEYRIESGLNCGGHAFATDGFLLGPILKEFKEGREQLIESNFGLLTSQLEREGKTVPNKAPKLTITVQGGVGTHEEHKFLEEEYNMDSVGWATPFLLVPEAVNVDKETLTLLLDAKENDLYLSNASPLGIRYNTMRGNSMDQLRLENIDKNRPGSSCPKEHLTFSSEFTEKPICTASRQYQKLKIDELEEQELPIDQFKKAFEKIVEKTCLCVGLTNPALKVYDLKLKHQGISVCPGPNLAYFSEILSLKEMISHIYGRSSIVREDRPNMFIKELNMYIDLLNEKIDELPKTLDLQKTKYINKFHNNLSEGIDYYKELFSETKIMLHEISSGILNDLESMEMKLNQMKIATA